MPYKNLSGEELAEKGIEVKRQRKNYVRGWKIFFYVLVAIFMLVFICVTIAIYNQMFVLTNNSNPQLIKSLNISKYMGDWYEIARLPVFFETGCSNVVASYDLNPNGSINVSNSCEILGNTSIAKGKALAVGRVDWDGTDLILSPGQIKVAFFGNFFGPYWVLDLDTVDYKWAMVGSPNRTTLWILSRTKSLDPAIYDTLVEKARNLNYPVWNLQKTIQV